MKKAVEFLKQNQGYFILGLFVVLGFALYSITFGNKMFWDDNDFILNNAFVHSWQYLPQYFSQNVIAGSQLISNYWRPLLLIVFSFEWHLWGAHVFGYHLVNLLFHIADALLLFYFIKTLFNKTWLAILIGIIFLIHPLQTEAVTYVNSLGDSLSVFFILLSLNNYLYFRDTNERKSFWWALVTMGLALLSKETAIIIPLLITLAEFFRDQTLTIINRLRNIFTKTWSFFALGIFYVLLRATVLNFQNTFNLYNQQNTFTAHLWVRILTFFRILWVYLGLLFCPHNLHMERSIDIAINFSADVIFGLLFFLCLIFIAVWAWKKHPEISFGALWFLIGLTPTSNIAVPINGLLYEHWLYLPLAGFFLMIFGLIRACSGSLKTSTKWRTKVLRYILVSVIILYFLFLGVTAIARNRQWRDPITLYNQTLQYAPDSYRVVNNLGMAYDDSGDHNLAKQMYERAIVLDPVNPVAYHNLGNLSYKLGQMDNAIKYFETAINKDPHFMFSYDALAQLYLDQKKYDQALAILQKLQAIDPSPTTQSYIDQINQFKAR